MTTILSSWTMRLALLLTLCLGALPSQAATLSAPETILQGVAFDLTLEELPEGPVTLRLDDRTFEVVGDDGASALVEGLTLNDSAASLELVDATGSTLASETLTAIPAWLSLLPALVAIVLALAFRQVILALFVGILLGGWIMHGMDFGALSSAFGDSVNVHVLEAASDSEHMSIVLFCLLIGGMVGIVSRNGGTQGIAQRISRVIRGRRQAQTSTFLLGIAIFFDDYANALIVGNTMRAITDKMAVSRAKLAYIIDSTAAPVSAIMLVTTWIGFQVGLISEAMSNISDWNESAYSVFVNAIPYNAYPILALTFVFMTTWLGRDFGPMLTAERRALDAGGRRTTLSDREAIVEEAEINTKPNIPIRAMNAIVPMLVLAAITLGGIYTTGLEALGPGSHSLRDIFGEGDSFSSMMWGSLASCVVAVIMTQAQRLMAMTETSHYWFEGVKSMLLPITILMMAWALANVNASLQTSDFLVAALGESLSPAWLPAVIFVLAGFTAFATGSSWGVMGIMMPLVVPLAWAVLEQNGMNGTAEGMPILYASVASVLAGAVWGDHCSPLADTTLLSAMASGCDLVEHVRTQLPYALLVGAVALIFGNLAVGYGISWWLGLAVGALILLGTLLVVGRRPERQPATAQTAIDLPDQASR
ncbi:Na+/H+ antiporter NhaC family protein [Halomonas icarae]|uniref:Na+/H+ antiporter NhaC family protein n=1 Tax=Halomonas icarae TaxID=2691040 RepID=A0A7X4VXF0_9GAMM|nr:Na+/H+ antiporter NhaC family protein [Halomonas icarae]MDR5901443.1 Na+/H+ antiporter NhaC family protein [Halomonas icarae]NAW11810.1 Na+/H+ antiporter NhaC family protein [Halomonas icarae]